MATTETISFGDGTTTQFSFTFPYIKTEDVRVELQEFDTAESTVISRVQISSFSIPSNNPTVVDFSAIGAATNYQAITGAPLTNHAVNTSNIIRVRIYRFTSADANPSTFLQGSAIRAQDLNDNFEQILYIMQERQNTIQAIQLGGIGENIIGTVSIQDDAITADKLRDSTLTDSDRAVTTNHIRDNAITTAKIANDAVTTAKIANDAVTTAKLASDLTVDLASGTAGSPSLTFDANTGLYSPGADQVAISTNGTGRLFVDSSGFVGIGTATPQSELTVRGSNPQITLEPTNDATQNCRIEFALADGTVQSRITGGGSDGSAIRFSQGSTERARIDSAGNVGIGVTNPGANLHINGNSNTELRIEDQGEYVSLLYNDNGSTLSVGVLNADNGNTSVADTELRIGVDGVSRYVIKADGSHTFYQANGITESMRISSAGAIGLSGANYGTSGQVLTSNGSASAPTWQTLSSPRAFTSYAIIEDQKGTGVDGGTFTSGSWQIRDLNTEVADPDGIVTLSSNEFTLGAGTYLIEWEAPAMRVSYHSTKLYDVTGASDAAYGTGEFADASGFVSNKSVGAHRVTLASSNTYRIEHRCNSTRADNGFGYTPSWSDGRFTKVKIWKE